ncbi:MAG: Fic family protein [Desulfosarcina sp.]|nr:Fic family protein [Desulfobacterales bacterium]
MKEFLTFKSGKLYFSDTYDEAKINNLLVRAIVLNETVIDLPILPELSSHLEPDIMYSSISGTAMIEGNPITGEDVKKIADGENIEIYTKKDKQEIKNLIRAYKFLASIEISKEPFVLTEKIIKELHKIITSDVPDEKNVPGQYRNGIVYVGDKAHGGKYTPPKILIDIKNLMAEFIIWINSDDILTLDPFLRAALAHYHFCLIHPFWDGNGRTARLIEAILLQSANIKYVPKDLSNYYYKNVDDYYISFSKSIKLKKDVTPFLEFMLTASVKSLTGIKDSIIYFIRKFSLRDLYAFEKQRKSIAKRQFDLLSLLLDNPIEFTLKDLLEKNPYSILYRKVSTQTARRDLKKLTEMKLFNLAENNKYYLNLRILG